jgi:hypothetical protein
MHFSFFLFFFHFSYEAPRPVPVRINLQPWILQAADLTPWKEDQPWRRVANYTGQHKPRRNAERHPCLEWDSNPRSQRLNRLKHFIS